MLRIVMFLSVTVFLWSVPGVANDFYAMYKYAENKEIAQYDFANTNKFLDLYLSADLQVLQDELHQAQMREKSIENKLLSGVTMGAMGAGGMMLATGLAEQKADKEAEQSMRAYMASFSCKFGDNRIEGGKTGVELSGGNELVALYAEYVNLANSLKERKTLLEMKAGIESESILDNSTSGLYDDENDGGVSGVYTSLARALADPNGEDAKQWNEQKEQTQRSNAAAARRHAELISKMTACNTNEECVIVDKDPCGCLKGPEGVTAINASYSLEFSKLMEKRFALATACPSVGSTEKECSASARPVCLQNRCKIGYQE